MARVLCLHGLGGTGATMWPVVGSLDAAGHVVLAPTLPGHGGTPDELVGVEWAAWVEATAAWPADAVVGQSMGAMLGLGLAAAGGVRAVVAINPLPADPDAIDGLEWRHSRGTEWIDVAPSTVGEIAAERLPIGALLEMHRGIAALDLAAVRVPVLIVTSAHDDVVDPAGSDVVAAALGGPVERLALPHSGHVATLDRDRSRLCAAITTFLARHLPTG